MIEINTHDVMRQAAAHFGMSLTAVQALCRIPTHPRELRDEFAMAALNTSLNAAALQDLTYADRAAWCYAQADAMLEARNANR